MLVLSRKPNQRIFIGDDVTITVNRIAGKQVSLGIDAPREVKVLRAELGPPQHDNPMTNPPPETDRDLAYMAAQDAADTLTSTFVEIDEITTAETAEGPSQHHVCLTRVMVRGDDARTIGYELGCELEAIAKKLKAWALPTRAALVTACIADGPHALYVALGGEEAA